MDRRKLLASIGAILTQSAAVAQNSSRAPATIFQHDLPDANLHGWSVTPTPDLYGLAVTHGEYTVSLMFGQRLVEYVQEGLAPGA